VARRYAQDAGAPARLALKIRSGGSGVWGEMLMPPHPQHTAAECASMVDWILSLAQTESASLPPGLSGTAQAPVPKNEWGRPQNGVLLLTATATDHGAGPMAALSSVPATVQLRTRRQRAYFFDAGEKALRQDNLDQGGMVARIPAGGEISFRQIDLSQCSGLTLEGWPQGSGKVKMEVWNGKGTVLGRAEADPGPGNGRPTLVRLPFTDRQADHALVDLSIHVLGEPGALLDVIWVDFLPW
jgi:cytochrome c